MPFKLQLPEPWAGRGWRAEIYDREGPEEPHVTILFKTQAWRVKLRTGDFLDANPLERLVPNEVKEFVRSCITHPLTDEWDQRHPHNPVASASVAQKAPTRESRKRSKKKRRK